MRVVASSQMCEGKEDHDVDQDKMVYEPPTLVEVGVFAELTRGSGFNELDAMDFFDFFSGF